MSKPIPMPSDSDLPLTTIPKSRLGEKSQSSETAKARVIGQFESVLHLRDAHAFGPKSPFARWLDEFSEQGDEATSPPPMA